MILIQRLRVRNSPIKAGRIERRRPHERLRHQQTIRDNTQIRVNGVPVRARVQAFIVLDDGEGGEEEQEGERVEGGVVVGSCFLLGGGVRGLEEEDRLG